MDISQTISFVQDNWQTLSVVGAPAIALLGGGSAVFKSREGTYQLGMSIAAIFALVMPEKIGTGGKPKHNTITDISAGMHDFSIGKINPKYPGGGDEVQST